MPLGASAAAPQEGWAVTGCPCQGGWKGLSEGGGITGYIPLQLVPARHCSRGFFLVGRAPVVGAIVTLLLQVRKLRLREGRHT